MLLSIALAISRLGHQQVCIYLIELSARQLKTWFGIPLLVQNQAEFSVG